MRASPCEACLGGTLSAMLRHAAPMASLGAMCANPMSWLRVVASFARLDQARICSICSAHRTCRSRCESASIASRHAFWSRSAPPARRTPIPTRVASSIARSERWSRGWRRHRRAWRPPSGCWPSRRGAARGPPRACRCRRAGGASGGRRLPSMPPSAGSPPPATGHRRRRGSGRACVPGRLANRAMPSPGRRPVSDQSAGVARIARELPRQPVVHLLLDRAEQRRRRGLGVVAGLALSDASVRYTLVATLVARDRDDDAGGGERPQHREPPDLGRDPGLRGYAWLVELPNGGIRPHSSQCRGRRAIRHHPDSGWAQGARRSFATNAAWVIGIFAAKSSSTASA